MTEVQSPYTVAALSRKPSGVRGVEFAFLDLNSSITLCLLFLSLSVFFVVIKLKSRKWGFLVVKNYFL